MPLPQLNPQVLVYDPNFVTRIALTTRLLEVGCQVRAESQLALALHSAGTLGWDMILLPISVPDADLATFLKDLEAAVPRSTIGIVCEAHDSARKAVASNAGARVLIHPLRPSSLSSHLRIRDDLESRLWLPIDAGPAKPDSGETPGSNSGGSL